jgi:hypothetical protein
MIRRMNFDSFMGILSVQSWMDLILVRTLFNEIRFSPLNGNPKSMKDIIVKQSEQTTWYENGQLIKEYLERPQKSSSADDDIQNEKLSILKLFKAARSRRKNS